MKKMKKILALAVWIARPGSFMRILRQRAGYTAGVHVLSGNDARSEANLRW